MKKIVCIILALVMCFGSTVEIFAKVNDKKYVSDIKIGYGDSGKQALINAGYIVNENFNANLNGRGDSVWVGFLETDDPLDAITDISVMRMNGAYSFSDWGKELAELQENIDALLADFMAGIEEFRANFAKHSPYAENALELLNYFIDADFTGECVGDLFLNKNTSAETINNIFLMGNMKYVSVIEQCIAMACTEWENPDDTFVTRLSKNGYAKEYDVSANHQRELVSNALSSFNEYMAEAKIVADGYENAYNVNKDTYLDLNDYVQSSCSDSEIISYYRYIGLVGKTKGITLKEDYTLYDLVTKESTEWVEEDYETVRLSMTKGQIGVLSAVGLDQLLSFEDCVHNDDMSSKMDEVMDSFYELNTETVSVYYGVDTSVFADPEDVALTSAAKRAVDGGDVSGFGVKKEEEVSKTYTYIAIACTVVAAVSFLASLGVVFAGTLTHTVVQESQYLGCISFTKTQAPYLSSGFVASVVAIAVILIIVAVIVVLIMKYLYEKEVNKELDDIEYKKIPRAIVDLKIKDGKKIYYTYTAAKRIDAKEGSDNTLEVYGDLNAYNKKNEWLAVYYSKNRDLGDPITSGVLVNPSEAPKSGYTAFHDFGDVAATDLNKLNSGKNSKEIYAYVKTTKFDEKGTDRQLGSVFSNSNTLTILVLTFIVGAFMAGLVTYKKTKKKYNAA